MNIGYVTSQTPQDQNHLKMFLETQGGQDRHLDIYLYRLL